MSKTEHKLKDIVKEYLSEKEEKLMNDINNRYLGIFMWGICMGTLISYTNLLSLSIGLFIGYSIAKKDIQIVHISITRVAWILEEGRRILNGKKLLS
jgi:hypothetical protein